MSQQSLAPPLAFLRMELRAGDVAARDHCGDGAAIIGGRQNIAGIAGAEFVGMHEIDMCAVSDAREQRMRTRDRQFVPPHMRNLERCVRRRQAHHFACDPAEPRMLAEFAADIREQLHPDANAEKWCAPLEYRLFE